MNLLSRFQLISLIRDSHFSILWFKHPSRPLQYSNTKFQIKNTYKKSISSYDTLDNSLISRKWIQTISFLKLFPKLTPRLPKYMIFHPHSRLVFTACSVSMVQAKHQPNASDHHLALSQHNKMAKMHTISLKSWYLSTLLIFQFYWYTIDI